MEKLWQLAGKDYIILNGTALELWTRICAYFKYCDDNPIRIKKVILTGAASGDIVYDEKPRPYTIKGLCAYCGVLEEDLKRVRQAKFMGSDYYAVVSKTLYIIHDQIITYAMIGEFSPVFSSKVLGIDKEDNTPRDIIKVEIIHGLPSLSTSESEILEKLESEKPLLENGNSENT